MSKLGIYSWSLAHPSRIAMILSPTSSWTVLDLFPSSLPYLPFSYLLLFFAHFLAEGLRSGLHNSLWFRHLHNSNSKSRRFPCWLVLGSSTYYLYASVASILAALKSSLICNRNKSYRLSPAFISVPFFELSPMIGL